MIQNLEDIIKQWLWKYLVEQSNFESHKDIFYEKTEYIPGGKDSVSFYFTDFRYKTLKPDIKINETKTKISELRSCTISITYNGRQAYRKLDKIAGLIRSSDEAADFLEEYSTNSDILALVDVSGLIGDNNIKESANLDVVLGFEGEQEKSTPQDGYIDGVDLEEIKLFE